MLDSQIFVGASGTAKNVHELVLEAVDVAFDTEGARLLHQFHEDAVLALCFFSWVVGLFTGWFCLLSSPKSHEKEVVRHRSRCQRAVAVRSHCLASFRTRVKVLREPCIDDPGSAS